MASISRPLAGPSMTFQLEQLIRDLRAEDAYQRSGRAGRTLAKSGRFRLTMVVAGQGVQLETHQADSPMTLQVIEGGLRYRDEGGEHELRQGDLLFFGPGSAEDIRSTGQSALLITLAAVDDDFRPDESASGAAGPTS